MPVFIKHCELNTCIATNNPQELMLYRFEFKCDTSRIRKYFLFVPRSEPLGWTMNALASSAMPPLKACFFYFPSEKFSGGWLVWSFRIIGLMSACIGHVVVFQCYVCKLVSWFQWLIPHELVMIFYSIMQCYQCYFHNKCKLCFSLKLYCIIYPLNFSNLE
jgi:hypothetical protein